jgi:hypothetical protein
VVDWFLPNRNDIAEIALDRVVADARWFLLFGAGKYRTCCVGSTPLAA